MVLDFVTGAQVRDLEAKVSALFGIARRLRELDDMHDARLNALEKRIEALEELDERIKVLEQAREAVGRASVQFHRERRGRAGK